MFGTILQRMIWWELVKVFSLCLVAITGLLLMAGLFAEATQRGLEPSQVLAILPLLIPSTLPYTLPATTLFAVCVVYGRLAHDNEILAVKAAGINLLHVVVPGILLGLAVSGATAALYYHTIPTTHYQLRVQVLNDVEEYLYSMLRRDGHIVHPKLNYAIFVRRVEGRKLIDAEFRRRDAKGQDDIIARAREAELSVDLSRKLILVHMRHCHVIGKEEEGKPGTGYIVKKDWPVELPQDIFSTAKVRDNFLTWNELFERRRQLREEIAGLEREVVLPEAVFLLHNAPEKYPQHIQDLRSQIRLRRQWLYSLEGEMHMRPALALGCLCFVLVGCPVGIWFSRSDYLSAFITCFLPIVVFYYPLLLCGINAGKNGSVPPEFSVWAANGLLGVCGVGLFRKLLKH